MEKWLISALLLSGFVTAHAQSSASNVVGARAGYVFDVDAERTQHDTELVLIDPPPAEPTLQQRLFDEKLTKEIRTEYQYRFGQTAMEQTINAPTNREDSYYYNYNGSNGYNPGSTVTADAYAGYQHSFAEYVGRKVGETQVDKFFNSDPALRPVYQYKDKLSNLTIKTDNGYKLKWRYNLSGNSADMELENPYKIQTKLEVHFYQFSPKTQEETFTASYPINQLYTVSTNYKFYDSVLQLVGSRRITPSLSASVTGLTTTNESGGPSVRQTIGLVGISWSQ